MNFIKNLWNKIKEPSGIWLILFYIFFALVLAGTILLVVFLPNSIINYFFYAITFFSLIYFIYSIIFLVYPKTKIKLIAFLRNHNITNKMLENKEYKTLIYAIIGFIVNIAYVSLQLTLGIITSSIWYITISIFYLILISIKAIIIYKAKKHSVNKLQAIKTYRNIGAMLVILTFAISGMAVLINKTNFTFKFAGVMIYVVALYTFYKIISALIQIVKYHKSANHYIKSIKCTNLVTALYSIWVLQVAMFQAFSPEQNLNTFNNITGGVIAAIILALSTFMIIKSSKNLENEKINQSKKEDGI